MPEFKDKIRELMATSGFIRFKKYSYILLKILLYPVFFPASLLIIYFTIELLIHIPLNIFTIKIFNIDISFYGIGTKKSICDLNSVIEILSVYTLLLFLFYSIFRRDALGKKAIKYFALVSALLNFAFAVMVIIQTQTDVFSFVKDVEHDCSYWKDYFEWFNEWWRTPFTVITSLIISYICLSVYSEKFCFSFPKKVKERFLKIRRIAFYLIVNCYFILVIVFSNMWHGIYPCPNSYPTNYKPHYEVYPLTIITHSMGIYGFASNHLLERETPANCEFGDRLY